MVKSHMCEHQRQILHVLGVWFGWLGRKSYMCRLLIGPKCLSFSEPYCGHDSGFTCVSIRGKSCVCRWFALVGLGRKSYMCRLLVGPQGEILRVQVVCPSWAGV